MAMTRRMRRLQLYVCVLLASLLVYTAVQRSHETTTSCYGSAENLRHLMLQETFQVCLCCDFGLMYSFN